MGSNPAIRQAVRLLGLALLAAASLPAAPPAPAPEARGRELAAALAAPEFLRRKAATEELLRLGWPAIPAVEELTRAADPYLQRRAATLLADLRLGIRPEWPDEWAALARGLDTMPSLPDRLAARERLAANFGEQALPLLLAALAAPDDSEARSAYRLAAKFFSPATGPQVLVLIPQPRGPWQARAVARAQRDAGRLPQVLGTYARSGLDDDDAQADFALALQPLQQLARDQHHQTLALALEPYLAEVPADARFRYLQALASEGLGQTAAAAAQRQAALALAPGQQAPHAQAAAFLADALQRPDLAAPEWQAVLAAPPPNSPAQLSALLRLSLWYEQQRQYAPAADALERFLAAHQTTGPLAAEAQAASQDLAQRLNRLRDLAAGRQPASATALPPSPPAPFRVSLGYVVKNDQEMELRQLLSAAPKILTLDVQPRGRRFFDEPGVAVHYHAQPGQIEIYQQGKLAVAPIPFQTDRPSFALACQSLDRYWFYVVDAASGDARPLARFELDYVLALDPGPDCAALHDPQATVNGVAWPWEQLLKGVTLDYLPSELDIVVRGLAQDGQPRALRLRRAVVPPTIAPIVSTK